jgi:hypothetical protein
MGIIVNKVALGFNYKNYDTPYFSRVAKFCPVSSTALVDGSFLICKAGGLAWFVAPASTQISSQWANGQYNSTSFLVGTKCCVSEWGTLGSCLSACNYTPTEWFVPTQAQLQNPGNVCRVNWGFSTGSLWSSTEGTSCVGAYTVCFCNNGNTYNLLRNKACVCGVRAFRCVTY